MSITYKDWKNLTAKSFHRRSTELHNLDKAFQEYESARGGQKDRAMQKLSTKFQEWKGSKGQGEYLNSIRNRNKNAFGKGPVELLESMLRTSSIAKSRMERTHAMDTSKLDRLVIDDSLKGRFDEIKVRETYNRAARAVEKAYEKLTKAHTLNSAERTLYIRWFGLYDENRHRIVKGNFKKLYDLFNFGVIIIHDARSQVGAWGDCFGFAMPGSKSNFVEFTVGRAFFEKTGYHVVPGSTRQQRNRAVQDALRNAYKNTTDWTVGTMVHELGHAINNLPDVDYQAPSSYQVSPGGLTPNGWEQCSTPDLDIDLALLHPNLAIRNTDNYGQFAREALG